MASGPESFWALSILTSIPAALASFALERRRRREMPDTLPFTWGYYVAVNCGLVGAFVIVAGILLVFTGENSYSPGNGAILSFFGLPFATAGYFGVRRSRAGLIIATILSFNMIWWIANTIYFRKRWVELRRPPVTPSAWIVVNP